MVERTSCKWWVRLACALSLSTTLHGCTHDSGASAVGAGGASGAAGEAGALTAGAGVNAGMGAAATAPGSGGDSAIGGMAAVPELDGGAGMGAAAGDGRRPGPDAGEMVRGSGPGDWVAGDYPEGLTLPNYLEISGVPGQQNLTRQYKVHVPPSYRPQMPMPLVFCIHGLGQDPLLFCVTGAQMPTKSDAEGFILVMPVGYQNSWNAGTCCGGASTMQLDEVALFRAIFAEVSAHLNVDLDRVYATGLSNGGYMSYRLACEASDLFTAIAPGAGAIGINSIGGGTNPSSDFVSCAFEQPVSILDLRGTADFLVSFALGAPTLSLAAMNNACGTATMPAPHPASGGDTACVTYPGCPSGVELTACTVEGGGHCWFGSPDCGTGAGVFGAAIVGANSNALHNTDAVWEFFKRQRR